MGNCSECSGTGVAERIGGYDRPCDVCRGDGRLPARRPPTTNPKHTSSDLVERLRGDWPEILVEKHWMMDSDAIDKQREEAADRIEALTAENERLREALERIAEETDHDCETMWITDMVRAALADTP